MWRTAIVFAIGCGGGGQSPPDGGPPLPDAPPVAKEVGPFTPQLCTGGTPGDPTCPVNQVSLDSIGASGARFEFVIQAQGSSLFVADTQIVAGASPVHVVHPELLHIDGSGVEMSTGDAYADFDEFITSSAALPDISFFGLSTDQLLLRFAVIELFDI